MKISEFIRELEAVKRQHGDIELAKINGEPFTKIILDRENGSIAEVIELD